jgi:hypothetical protein
LLLRQVLPQDRINRWDCHRIRPPLVRNLERIRLACAAISGGGKALPIMSETRSFLISAGNLYLKGKPCKTAASRSVMARLSAGCRNRPFEGLLHPLVMVGATSFHAIRPYMS